MGSMYCCGRYFKKMSGLATHQSLVHGVKKRKRIKFQKRHSYTLTFKASALAYLYMSLLVTCGTCGCFTPPPDVVICRGRNNKCMCGNRACRSAFTYQYQVADKLGIHASLLCKWNKRCNDFHALVADKPKMKKLHTGTNVQFPLCEDILYEKFLERRLLFGLPVDHYWLRAKFLEILNIEKPDNYKTARLSNGWLYRFVTRYDISNRMKTDKKNKSVEDRIDLIRQFHLDLCLFLKEGEQRCPTYGRYPLEYIWNADHVPLPFCINMKRSLNPKGEQCWIATVGSSGLDKRQATIHMCIRAKGEQFMPCFIIFRGLSCPTESEREQLDAFDNIMWAFQKKAWADGKYSRMWMRTFGRLVNERAPGEHLLLLDELGCQKTSRFNDVAFAHDVFPFPLPPCCTDIVQPVDHNVGAKLKEIMKGLYKIEVELNYDEWRDYKSNKALSASRRRVLMATWLDAAWGFLKLQEDFLYTSFLHTVLIKLDGTHEFKFRGYHKPYPYFK